MIRFQNRYISCKKLSVKGKSKNSAFPWKAVDGQ